MKIDERLNSVKNTTKNLRSSSELVDQGNTNLREIVKIVCQVIEKILQYLLSLNHEKSNFYYTHDIPPNRVTSGGVYFRGFAPAGQHSFEGTSQRWRHCAPLARPDNGSPDQRHR